MKHIKLDATPPGQEPIKITPAAISASTCNTEASKNPLSGMIKYCKLTPIKTGRGIFKTRAKSARQSVVPMPNMMTWINGTISVFKSNPNHDPNQAGYPNDAATDARTNDVNANVRWPSENRNPNPDTAQAAIQNGQAVDHSDCNENTIAAANSKPADTRIAPWTQRRFIPHPPPSQRSFPQTGTPHRSSIAPAS